MKSVVIGATGFVGRALVSALARRGEAVRAASRTPARAGVEWVECDLMRPDTVARAVEGTDVVYYLVHSMGRADFREVDRRCAHTLAEAATSAGCTRVVYLGGVAPKGRTSQRLASRLEVGEILRARTHATELRASMIVDNGSLSWRIVRDLAARLPVMALPRWLESRTCPVALPDVVDALLAAREAGADGWFDIPGPEALTMHEMLEIVAALDGRRIPAVRVPVLTPGLSAMWLKLVTRAEYAGARELVLGLTEDLLPQRSFWDVVGVGPRWTFHAAAAHALATEAPPRGLARTIERLIRRASPHADLLGRAI